MATKTYYEWTLETLDENGDIDDSDFSDKLGSAFGGLLWSESHNVGLVKNEYRDDGQLMERTWAYCEEGCLPALFEDGSKVPQRFHNELLKFKAE